MDDLWVVGRAIVSLAAVLGLLIWLNRRLSKGQAAGGNPLRALLPKRLAGRIGPLPGRAATGPRRRPEKINVVARSGLGGRAQLVVAEFNGIRYVLGVTEHGISVVDTQEAPVDEALEGLSAAEPEDDERDGGTGPALKTVA